MTYEKGLFAQADPGIVSGSTIERKKMSTKTIYKRIALIAVAALGAGVLSVAPASALATVLTVTAGTPTYGGGNTLPTVGSTVRVPVTLAINWDDAAAAEAITIVGTITTPNNAGTVAVTADVVGAAGTYAGTATAGEVLPTAATTTISYTSPTQGIDQSDLIGGMNFTPTVPGNYVLTLTPAVGATGGTARTVNINVGGVALTQGNANLGQAATGTQIVGRLSTVTFNVPSGVSAGARYQITSTSPINTVFSGTANLAAGVAAHTASTGVTAINGVNFTNGATYTVQAATTTSEAIAGNDYDSDMEQVSVGIDSPAAAGVVTVLFRSIGATTGALTTVGTATITYGSADLLTLSVANTTIHKAKSNDAPSASTDVTAIVQSAAVGTQRANILVTVNNGNNTALVGQTVSATIAGPGLIAWGNTGTGVGTAAGSVSVTLGAGENDEFLLVSGSGVGGVATITFAIGTTVLGTETITFFGAVSRYTATTNIVAAANGTTSSDVVTVCALDAANVAVPNATIFGFSGDTTVATMAESSDDTEPTAVVASGTSMANHVAATAIGCVGFSITGLTQLTKPSVVLTFGNAASIATSTITTTATVLVGAVAASSVALTADKATYAPGAAVVLTLTYRDSAGRPVAHGPGTGTLAASLVGSSALSTADLFATANSSKLGSTTQTVYAPLSAGPVTVSGLTGADVTYLVATARGVAVSATFTVAAPANAELATLTTLVNSLIAKINALNKLVIKIQKKVRA